MKNLPKKIYLQVDPENECDEQTDFNSLAGITWSTERINKSDVEYVLNSSDNWFNEMDKLTKP